ncbi:MULTISPECIES: sugar ABC transporter ATP-binding protein [Anaerolinea]|uniref:ABC transporter ATP-binding protein n=1 Tax=Anaerolinea thermophila (strain DSM 14523 / JCM 11388 / NBRC 100420 / UNI-1) TaxID=926569 RepID=E8N2D8_ANATU|nr:MULTISPECIES: ATP-binding cassette domain-containing protein [Anaerolinea]BAJ62744.1 putative ABC transporter ATP-binding protein [Anaerolinea thermophila UNI-1]
MNTSVVLSLKSITKKYPGVLALDRVSLDFFAGEVHALVGENGAGKSTLIKAIAGAINLDGGVIQIGGQDYHQMTPHLSRSAGIEVIYQEFNLVPTMSVAENIFLGEKPNTLNFVNYRLMKNQARELFRLFDVDMDPDALVQDLSPAQQQIVEIAKAVSKNVKILIMDEPSAPLSVSEVERMFEIIRQLKRKGVTIIYISHRLEEIFKISDRVSVLRDGKYVATKLTSETNREELIRLMVGRELKETYPARTNPPGEIALEVKNLSGNGVRDISFVVRKGEILGVAGLVGAGRTEMAMLIFGAAPIESGEIRANGKLVRIRSPQDAIQHRIGLLTEDRKGKGLFLEMPVGWNITFPIVRKLSRFGVVDTQKEKSISEYYWQHLNIKTPSLEERVINLSGGNQQKVVLAKVLAADSAILIFDEPTRGIDVGAKQEIYHLMCELANNGNAILMISSDMEELLGMSDRIIVLCEGKLAGEVSKDNFSQDLILDLASGTH